MYRRAVFLAPSDSPPRSLSACFQCTIAGRWNSNRAHACYFRNGALFRPVPTFRLNFAQFGKKITTPTQHPPPPNRVSALRLPERGHPREAARSPRQGDRIVHSSSVAPADAPHSAVRCSLTVWIKIGPASDPPVGAPRTRLCQGHTRCGLHRGEAPTGVCQVSGPDIMEQSTSL